MHVLSIVGARPQFIKLAPVVAAFRRAGIAHTVVHTGQHYDHSMSDVFFRDLLIPAPDVHLGAGSASHAVQTAAILSKLDPVIDQFAPDWVLVYGDTNSTIAGALATVKKAVPLAHLEAGLRSWNRSMPEEHNRVLTDHAADLCLAPTVRAVQNLEVEGLSARTRLVGDVMADVCIAVHDRVIDRPILVDRCKRDEPFVLATIHRAENTDDPRRLAKIIDALKCVDELVVLPAHPRLRERCKAYDIDLAGLHVVDPLTYPRMISAVLQSIGVVTDSGGLQKEALLLETSCTTVRTETEWPETLDGGWNVLDPTCEHLVELAARPVPSSLPSRPFGDGRAASLVASTLSDFRGETP